MHPNKIIMNGTRAALEIKEQLAGRIKLLGEQGITPCLAVILAGDNPASRTYVRMKGKACEQLGIESKRILLNQNISTDELISVIHRLNDDPHVRGILLQHPVPHQIDERAAFEAISI